MRAARRPVRATAAAPASRLTPFASATTLTPRAPSVLMTSAMSPNQNKRPTALPSVAWVSTVLPAAESAVRNAVPGRSGRLELDDARLGHALELQSADR